MSEELGQMSIDDEVGQNSIDHVDKFMLTVDQILNRTIRQTYQRTLERACEIAEKEIELGPVETSPVGAAWRMACRSIIDGIRAEMFFEEPKN